LHGIRNGTIINRICEDWVYVLTIQFTKKLDGVFLLF
jgi:hypothetical protein